MHAILSHPLPQSFLCMSRGWTAEKIPGTMGKLVRLLPIPLLAFITLYRYTVSSLKKKVLPSWEYYPVYYLQIPVFPLRKFEVVTFCPPVGKTKPSDQKMDFALPSTQILTSIGVTIWTFKNLAGVWLWLFVHRGLKRWICNSGFYVANSVLLFSRVFGFYLLKQKKNKICKFVQVQSRK